MDKQITNNLKYKLLLIFGVALIAILLATNHQAGMPKELFLVLLILMVSTITISIHGLMVNYWGAAIIGALICFVPIALELFINPGRFGFYSAVPGLLIYLGVVFGFSLIVGIPMHKSKREINENGI